MAKGKGKEEKKDILSRLEEMNLLNKEEVKIKSGILLLDMFVAGENSINDRIGWLKGKTFSISGPNGIGKSTMLMELIKRWAKQKLKIIFFDYENGLSEKSISDLGLTEFCAFNAKDFISGKKNFLVMNPHTYSATISLLFAMLEDEDIKIDVVMFDSLAMIQPKYIAENLDDIEQLPIGLKARSEGTFLPLVKNLFSKHNVLGIYINQFRNKFNQYGAVLDEPTGQAFLYGMDIRMVMKPSKEGKIVKNVINGFNGTKVEKVIGNWVELWFKKSRAGNSFSAITIPLVFGKGISVNYLYTSLIQNRGIVPFGARIDSKLDMTKLKEGLLSVGMDVSSVPDSVSGWKGLFEFVANNFEMVEKLVIDQKMLFIDSDV